MKFTRPGQHGANCDTTQVESDTLVETHCSALRIRSTCCIAGSSYLVFSLTRLRSFVVECVRPATYICLDTRDTLGRRRERTSHPPTHPPPHPYAEPHGAASQEHGQTTLPQQHDHLVPQKARPTDITPVTAITAITAVRTVAGSTVTGFGRASPYDCWWCWRFLA